MTASTRERLPDWREAETLVLEAAGLRYHATVGRHEHGRISEVFINSSRVFRELVAPVLGADATATATCRIMGTATWG